MVAIRILLASLVVAVAAAAAGCLGADDTTNTPPPTNRSTGNNNTTAPPPAPVTGGANITGAGPSTSQSVTITVSPGHTRLTVSFAERSSVSQLPASVPVQNFQAVLSDPAGNETATASATSATLGAEGAAAGAWTLAVSFAAPPTTVVEVVYTVE